MKQGFSLIEFTIYLVAFSCIVTLALQSVVKLVHNVRTRSQLTHQTLQLYTALDVMAYEIQNAPFKTTYWYEKGAQICMWYCKQQNKTVSLQYQNKKIFKITGTYDKDQKKWLSKVSNILIDNLDDCQLSYATNRYENEEHIKSMVISLKTMNQAVEKNICLKNGYHL